MAKEYDPEIEAMLRGDGPQQQSRSGHMGPQFQLSVPKFEPVVFDEGDFSNDPRDVPHIEGGDNYVQIGSRRYPGRVGKVDVWEDYDDNDRQLPTVWSRDHAILAGESGWHARIGVTHYETENGTGYPEELYPEYYEQGRNGKLGRTALGTGNVVRHVPQNSAPWARFSDAVLDPELVRQRKEPFYSNSRNVYTSAEPPSAGDIGISRGRFFTEQGIHKAIEAIGRLPRPKGFGPPLRFPADD